MVKCLFLSLQTTCILTFNYTIYLTSTQKVTLAKACKAMANIPQKSRENRQNSPFAGP